MRNQEKYFVNTLKNRIKRINKQIIDLEEQIADLEEVKASCNRKIAFYQSK